MVSLSLSVPSCTMGGYNSNSWGWRGWCVDSAHSSTCEKEGGRQGLGPEMGVRVDLHTSQQTQKVVSLYTVSIQI